MLIPNENLAWGGGIYIYSPLEVQALHTIELNTARGYCERNHLTKRTSCENIETEMIQCWLVGQNASKICTRPTGCGVAETTSANVQYGRCGQHASLGFPKLRQASGPSHLWCRRITPETYYVALFPRVSNQKRSLSPRAWLALITRNGPHEARLVIRLGGRSRILLVMPAICRRALPSVSLRRLRS